MKCTSSASIVLLVACGLLLVACGGGGGDPAYEFDGDLTGSWQLSTRPTGDSIPPLPLYIAPIEQIGSNVMLMGEVIPITGNTIHLAIPSETSPDRKEINLRIKSDDLIEGTQTEYDNGVLDDSIDVRFQRTATPSGVMSCGGWVVGEWIVVDSLTSYAMQAWIPSNPSIDLKICNTTLQGNVEIEIFYNSADLLSPGTYWMVPQMTPSVTIRTDHSSEDAVSGTLTIDEYSASHVRGSGNVVLESGEQFSFAFDVDILVEFNLEDYFGPN